MTRKCNSSTFLRELGTDAEEGFGEEGFGQALSFRINKGLGSFQLAFLDENPQQPLV